MSASSGPAAQGPDETTRVVPYVCPFCGEEDLRPLPRADHAIPGHGQTDRSAPRWHCRSCLRVFSVAFYGLLRPTTTDQQPRTV